MSEPAHRLEVSFSHRIGGLALDVAFRLTQPWTVLFAPSGAGKSTVLRVIAGLIRPDSGVVISLSGESEPGKQIVLTDSARHIAVPVHRRGVRFVGQQAALFTHRTALENIKYGARPEEDASLPEILRICRVEHLLTKRTQALSGGERQRVALARALGASSGARALLLDEPFTGLDVALRDAITPELKTWLKRRRIPVLHVTHDIGEVFALADEVIRMADGRIAAQGPASDVLRVEREWLFENLNGRAVGA